MIEKGYTIPVLDHGFVRYIDSMGNDERICEAARISYKSPSKGPDQDKKLLTYLWKHKHTSPFEMVKITFNIKLPIFVMRQFVRHRMQNLNEMSARYTELPNEFYIPEKWRKQDTKNKQGSMVGVDWDWPCPELGNVSVNDMYSQLLKQHCDNSYNLYERLLSEGVAREMARMVLPVNIYTEIYSTWDLNNLLKFMVLRDDDHAQIEIQEYSKAMKIIIQELFPWSIEAYDQYKFQWSEVKKQEGVSDDHLQSSKEN